MGILASDALGFVAKDLEMAVAAQLELALALDGLGIRRHREYISLRRKLRLVDGPLAGNHAVFPGIQWLFHFQPPETRKGISCSILS